MRKLGEKYFELINFFPKKCLTNTKHFLSLVTISVPKGSYQSGVLDGCGSPTYNSDIFGSEAV